MIKTTKAIRGLARNRFKKEVQTPSGLILLASQLHLDVHATGDNVLTFEPGISSISHIPVLLVIKPAAGNPNGAVIDFYLHSDKLTSYTITGSLTSAYTISGSIVPRAYDQSSGDYNMKVGTASTDAGGATVDCYIFGIPVPW